MKSPLVALGVSLLFSGCIVPGTPYYGNAVAPPPLPPPPGMVVTAPEVVIGAPPVVVAPVYVRGCGYGYWYGNRFWPYRRGCHFYNGYYYGYRRNWR